MVISTIKLGGAKSTSPQLILQHVRWAYSPKDSSSPKFGPLETKISLFKSPTFLLSQILFFD
jgi:hypothetical protein